MDIAKGLCEVSLKTAEGYRSGLQFKPVFAKDFFLKSASNWGELPFILPSFRFLFGCPSLPTFLSASPKTDCRWKKLIGLTRPLSQDDTTACATAALSRTATWGGRAERRRIESLLPNLHIARPSLRLTSGPRRSVSGALQVRPLLSSHPPLPQEGGAEGVG